MLSIFKLLNYLAIIDKKLNTLEGLMELQLLIAARVGSGWSTERERQIFHLE